MVVRRRMILQLTSLVDLLFIVMFLQYMELQDATSRQVRAESSRRVHAETARKDADRLKNSALANTADMTQRLADLQSENRQLQDQLKEAEKKAAVATVGPRPDQQRPSADLKAIAAAVKDILGIAPDALTAAISSAPQAEQAKLRQRIEELRNKPPAQIIKHLRETAELKKYCEIWEVHVNSDESVMLKIAGEDAGDRFFIRSADEFANRLVSAARDHGEPKSLVIICITWADADLTTRQNVLKGAGFAVIALKPEWGGTKRIEVAKLGYSEAL